jgi:arylsulfatase
MVYTFADAKAKDRHRTQYFEIFGNRGIYHDGWLAHTVHRAAWEMTPRRPLLEDKWELYHVDEDFSSADDLAAKHPEKLKELQERFLEEAIKNHVLPLDDRTLERTNAALAGRPDLMAGRTSLTVYEGMVGMTENVFINTKNTSHTITAEVQVPKGGANGVILSQAGRFGGWSLYVKDGLPFTGVVAVPVLRSERVRVHSPMKRSLSLHLAISGHHPLRAAPGPLLSSPMSSPARRLQDFPVPPDLAPEHPTGSSFPGDLQPPGNSDGASAPSNHAPTAASRYANTERPC